MFDQANEKLQKELKSGKFDFAIFIAMIFIDRIFLYKHFISFCLQGDFFPLPVLFACRIRVCISGWY